MKRKTSEKKIIESLETDLQESVKHSENVGGKTQFYLLYLIGIIIIVLLLFVIIAEI